MKVLHIAPTPFFSDRGCHIRILGEIHSLQEQGVQVELATYHLGRDVEKVKTKRTINIPWYKDLSVGGSWHKLYIDFLLLAMSVITAIKFRPLLIHGHLHEGALIAKLTSWIISLGRIPVVFDVQGSLTGELKTYGMLGKNGFLYKMMLSIEKFICRIPDYIVCSSKANLKYIINHMNIPSEKVSELIDGVLFDMKSNVEKVSIKKQLNITTEKIVVYSGSLLESKGVNYMIHAFPKILQSYKNVKFLIIGYPIEKTQELVKNLNIEDSVIFLGRVNFFKLPEYLSISDIAVGPKVDKAHEGSGKIINYMGAGLPVVCFDSPNNRHFLGENGVFAETGNSESLAEKILLLLNDEIKCKELGLKNKKRTEESFSWDAKGRELLKIYQGLINN